MTVMSGCRNEICGTVVAAARAACSSSASRRARSSMITSLRQERERRRVERGGAFEVRPVATVRHPGNGGVRDERGHRTCSALVFAVILARGDDHRRGLDLAPLVLAEQIALAGFVVLQRQEMIDRREGVGPAVDGLA